MMQSPDSGPPPPKRGRTVKCISALHTHNVTLLTDIDFKDLILLFQPDVDKLEFLVRGADRDKIQILVR